MKYCNIFLLTLFFYLSTYSNGLTQIKILDPENGEILISKDTSRVKEVVDIAIDFSGNGIVVWDEKKMGKDSTDIYGQLIHTNGLRGDSSFIINSFRTHIQKNAKVAMDAVGNFVVVWESVYQAAGWDIYGQRYNNLGQRMGPEFQVNDTIEGAQFSPDIAMRWNGDFVIVWLDEGKGIKGKMYDKEGSEIKEEFLISTEKAERQGTPKIAMDYDGNFTTIWFNNNSDIEDSWQIKGRQFDQNGTALKSFKIDTQKEGSQNDMVMSMNWEGDFIVAWVDNQNNIYSDDVYAMRYTKKAIPVTDTGPFLVNTNRREKQQLYADVAMREDGSYFISWAGPYGLWGKAYDRNNIVKDSIRLNISDNTARGKPAFAVADNHSIAVWNYNNPYTKKHKIYGVKVQPYIEVSDELADAIQLPVNTTACGNLSISTNLSLASRSYNSVETCIKKGAKDVWFKVKVPTSGNFLIKQQSDTATVAMIEAYSKNQAGELTRIDSCHNISDLPYVALFTQLENTFDNTVYLRLWQNESNDTNNIKLSAHFLAKDSSLWELCDYPASALNVDGAGRKIGIEFLLQYDTLFDEESRRVIRDKLRELGAQKVDSCNCAGDIPLELWINETLIDLNEKGQVSSEDPPVDTTHSNYIIPYKEVQFYSEVAGQQTSPSVGIDNEGNFVLAWSDNGRDGSGYGVLAQRFKWSGEPQSESFLVNTYTESYQNYPSVAMNGDGKFGITWRSNEQNDVTGFSQYAQLYDSVGIKVGGEISISPPYNSHIGYADMDSTGNMKLVHFGKLPDNEETQFIVRTTIDSIGKIKLKNQIIRLELGNKFTYPAISSNEKGQSIIVYSGPNDRDVVAHLFDAKDNLDTTFIVDETNAGSQWFTDVAMNNKGEFVVVWRSGGERPEDKLTDVYGKKYTINTAGDLVSTGEFKVNNREKGLQEWPRVGIDDYGNFMVVWQTRDTIKGPTDIQGRLFNREGCPVAKEFSINKYKKKDQRDPVIAMNKDGKVIVSWQSDGQDLNGYGIYSKRYAIIPVGNDSIRLDTLNDIEFRMGLGAILTYDTTEVSLTDTSNSIPIIIVDTGVKKNHPSLTKHLWRNPNFQPSDGSGTSTDCETTGDIGINTINENLEPIDNDGHGTAVNAMLVNKDTTQKEVAIKLMNAKFHDNKKGKLFDAVCGIYYGVKHGAKVMNLSWGFESKEYPKILLDALKYAAKKDVLIINSSGNTGQNNDDINRYPGNFHNELDSSMIVVGAYQVDKLLDFDTIKLSRYSNYGNTTVHLAARGYVETLNNEWNQQLLTTKAGTSMATPQVARTAAIIRAKYPSLKAKQVYECLMKVDKIENMEGKLISGGILNQKKALAHAEQLYNRH